jgi:drug/metabolite transporter (DMT)-like permease
MSRPPPDRPFYAIGLRIIATLCFAAMFVLAKQAQAGGANLVETLFCRQAIAAVPVCIAALAGPGLGVLRLRSPWGHATRTIAGMTSMTLNFLTVTLIPLAEAQTLWFTTPLFATMLAAIFLHERVGWHRWGAVIAGLLGVLLVIQPGAGSLPLGGAASGLAAGFTVAITSILVRQLAQREPALAIVFWFGVLSAVPLALTLPWTLHTHPPVIWAELVGTGLIGGVGQIALTNSLRYGAVATVVPIDYISLIWSTLAGLWLFGEVPVPGTWIGAPVIIASGLYIVWREHRRTRHTAIANAGEAP